MSDTSSLFCRTIAQYQCVDYSCRTHRALHRCLKHSIAYIVQRRQPPELHNYVSTVRGNYAIYHTAIRMEDASESSQNLTHPKVCTQMTIPLCTPESYTIISTESSWGLLGIASELINRTNRTTSKMRNREPSRWMDKNGATSSLCSPPAYESTEVLVDLVK
jgi:hypothetical protein